MRHHSPSTTTPRNIEDGIQYFSPSMFAWTPGHLVGWQVWRNYHPFGIIEISRVSLSGFGHSASLPDFSPVDKFSDAFLKLKSALNMNLGMSYLGINEMAAADEALSQARQIGEACGDLFNAYAAVAVQADVARGYGKLDEATAICQDALQSIAKSKKQGERPIPYAGSVYIALGQILFYQNKLEEAEKMLLTGINLIQLTSTFDVQVRGYVVLAQVSAVRAEWEKTHDWLDKAAAIGERNRQFVDAQRVEIWLNQTADDPKTLSHVLRWIENRQISLAPETRIDFEQMALARALIAQYRSDPNAITAIEIQELQHFLSKQLALAEEVEWVEWMIRILTLQALLWQVGGNLKNASTALKLALELAEPGNFVRYFLDDKQMMIDLLQHVSTSNPSQKFAQKLLDHIDRTDSFQSVYQPLVEPLSQREIEVLQLVARGLSNPEIADTLVISIHTVKKHITNIFGKLEVTSRTQAVAKGREIGLVD